MLWPTLRGECTVGGACYPKPKNKEQAADQPREEEGMKTRFLVAINLLYLAVFCMSSLASYYLESAFALGSLPSSPALRSAGALHPGVLFRWTTIAFCPLNLLVFWRFNSHRMSILMFLLYFQTTILWLCLQGQLHEADCNLIFLAFAVGGIHVGGKKLGWLVLAITLAEVLGLEAYSISNEFPSYANQRKPSPFESILLRISILSCICLTSLLHEHFHNDAALRLQKCMNQQMKFFAIISHDLRAPLESIKYVASDILKEELSSEVQQVLNVIRDSSEHILALLNNFLELSRCELGSLKLRSQKFDLAKEINKLVRRSRVLAEKKKIELITSIDLKNRLRKGDPIRFCQVMDNLISNAMKFTREGYVEVKLTEAVDDPHKIRVEVVDSGVGIDSKVIERLFKCFAQAETELDNSHGYGFGLAICKKICQAMNGSIHVESAPQKGSRFWFEVRLPIYQEETETDPGSSSSGRSEEREPIPELSSSSLTIPTFGKLRGKRVLVVDDSELIHVLMRRMLSKLGCQVEICWNGNEAIARLQDCGVNPEMHFDAILCDLHMPGIDGFKTAEAIRSWEDEPALETGEGEQSADVKRKRKIPIIGMSASMLDDEEKHCLAHGMNDFLLKPPSAERLRTTLEKWIATSDELGEQTNEHEGETSSEVVVSTQVESKTRRISPLLVI